MSSSSAHARHANNVQFVKWFESARIRYTETLDLPAQDIRNVLVSVRSRILRLTLFMDWTMC